VATFASIVPAGLCNANTYCLETVGGEYEEAETEKESGKQAAGNNGT
jgi:hypothetical protein